MLHKLLAFYKVHSFVLFLLYSESTVLHCQSFDDRSAGGIFEQFLPYIP